MLPQFAYLSEEESVDRRRAARRTINLLAVPTAGPPVKRLILLNLSKTGLRFHCLTMMRLGETVVVTLPQAGEVEATIRWKTEHEYGAEFASPISAGAVSATLLAAPASLNPATSSEKVSSVEVKPLPLRYVTLGLLTLLFAVVVLVGALGFLPVSGL